MGFEYTGEVKIARENTEKGDAKAELQAHISKARKWLPMSISQVSHGMRPKRFSLDLSAEDVYNLERDLGGEISGPTAVGDKVRQGKNTF